MDIREFNEYQRRAQAFSSTASAQKVLCGVMGLAGESGECVDLVKKQLFQGHLPDKEKLITELGDVLWYCAELAEGLGVSLSEAAGRNLEKLSKRYPEGHFEAQHSLHRET